MLKKLVDALKRLACRIGWHSYDDFSDFDGCNARARCRWCGFEGLIDSQGNLF